jgi:hypothetical protein
MKYKKHSQSLKDVESDSADMIDLVDYDILNQFPQEKNNEPTLDTTLHTTLDTTLDTTNAVEMFYDSPNTTFPAAISQGDASVDGKNCHWKMYKKPNYYGYGPWGKFHYGEPYSMKIRCEGDNNCSDDMSVSLNCLNKFN